MPTDDRKPRQKQDRSGVILAAVILLTFIGGAGLYALGREDPRKAAGSPTLAWGDRVERRMDAFVERVRPAWADRVEARLEAFADRVGWD